MEIKSFRNNLKQAIQIHDYLSVSFFRQPAEVKAASQKIIKLFSDNYPETVSYKYFVNVPLVMQWMMGAMKALISKDTFQKMTWLTYGNTLHTYLGDNIPPAYGGKGAPLVEKGLTPKYDNDHAEAKADEVAPTSKEAPNEEPPETNTSLETPTSTEKSKGVTA
jgi:phosphatidylinositol transfer protein SFH5